MAGRPPKTEVDPIVAKAVCDNLELGMPMSLAAEAEGIGRTTIYDWIERFPEFAEQITRARAQGAKKLTKIVFEAGPAHAQWLLERRYRDDYAPPKKEDVQPSEVRITIEGGLPAFHVEQKPLLAEEHAVDPVETPNESTPSVAESPTE